MSKSNTPSLLKFFDGDKCHILSSDGELKAEGIFIAVEPSMGSFNQIKEGIFQQDSDEDNETILVKIKGVDRVLADKKYSILAMREDDDGSYQKVYIDCVDWQINGTMLYEKINFNDIIIDEVKKDEFEQFTKTQYKFDWSNIKTTNSTTGTEKEDAFEDLCIELLNTWKVKDLNRIGKGVDRGRDATCSFKDCKIPLIEATSFWVVQCKYSVSYKALEIQEIYKEMVKVIMHKPDHYLLITNRKITSDFSDWINNQVFSNTDYFIPFKVHLIQKEQLEAILSTPQYRSIMQKYFD
jgi:hypothetical protein